MLLLKRNLFAAAILVLGIIWVVGCSDNSDNHNEKTRANESIDEEKAKEIALNDVPNFKSNNSNFEVYSVERTEMGYRNSKVTYDSWVVVISSQEPNEDSPSPNILYQINAKDGTIIDKTNHALAE